MDFNMSNIVLQWGYKCSAFIQGILYKWGAKVNCPMVQFQKEASYLTYDFSFWNGQIHVCLQCSIQNRHNASRHGVDLYMYGTDDTSAILPGRKVDDKISNNMLSIWSILFSIYFYINSKYKYHWQVTWKVYHKARKKLKIAQLEIHFYNFVWPHPLCHALSDVILSKACMCSRKICMELSTISQYFLSME